MDSGLQVIANILSALTIMSCVFLKVPQIMSIKKRKSAEGMYVQAMVMEITGFSIMTLYNYTNDYGIMTYMEYPVILFQVYVLLYYVLLYKKLLHLPVVPIAAVTYVVAVLGFMAGMFPKEILSFLIPLCTPLSGGAKVMYIYGMIKSKNADSVSLSTWIISVATNFFRVFTVYVDSADPSLLFNFTVSTLLSSGVLGTAVYYQYLVPPPPPTDRPRRQPSYRRNSETYDKYD